MVKFTKGPWKVSKTGLTVFDPTGRVVAALEWRKAEERKATAQLIAAAPEMYQTLENIVEYWNRDRNDKAMHDALWHIIEAAQEALTKAEGEKL